MCALALISTPVAARAQGGVFDVLDPCICAGETVAQNRSKMQAEVQRAIAKAEVDGPTEAFAKAWWLEKRKVLRTFFDKNVVPQLPAGLTKEQKDLTFNEWLKLIIAREGGWLHLNQITAAEWTRLVRLDGERATEAVNASLDKQDAEFRAQCPADFGNQLLRGTLTLATAPINMQKRVFEIAGRESTVIGKLFAVGTFGGSLDDIHKNGLQGGSGSVVNETKDFVARTFGFKW